jgi:hypothetical protein
MAKIICVLYDDPVDGYPKSYPRDDLPKIVHYPGGPTLPTPKAIDFKPGALLGSVSGELGLRRYLESNGHTFVVTSDKDGPGSVSHRSNPAAVPEYGWLPAGRLIYKEATMVKVALIVIISATLMATVGAKAQNDDGLVAPELSTPRPGQLLRQDYITDTGATVDRPGVPQASGQTALDRSIRQQNNRINNSICDGC